MKAAYNYDILNDRDYENFQDGEFMNLKNFCELNLSDLMGEDHAVWIKRNDKFGFDVEVTSDEEITFTKFTEKGVHPFAVDSLATFCRRFLHFYDRILDNEVIV